MSMGRNSVTKPFETRNLFNCQSEKRVKRQSIWKLWKKFKNEYLTYYIDFDFKIDFCIFAVRIF